MNWFFLRYEKIIFTIGGIFLSMLALWGTAYVVHGRLDAWWVIPFIISGIVVGLVGVMLFFHGALLRERLRTSVSWGGHVYVHTDDGTWMCPKEHFKVY